MMILLPPSETKRSGGSRAPLDLARLALPALTPERDVVIDALVALCQDEDAAVRVLKLSARQRDEVAVNAVMRTSPTMAAVDRYTGVLYDALDAGSLDATARRWLGRHVLVHSAPFGPVGALDPIPGYRLAAGASLPGIPPLKRVWAGAVGAALRADAPRFVLDLRSEAYCALGAVPAEIPSAYVRVVTEGDGGAVRALNHFNKHAKGALVRRLAATRPRVASAGGFVSWANAEGMRAERVENGEIHLFA